MTKFDIMNLISFITMLGCSVVSIYVLWKYRAPKNFYLQNLWVDKKQSETSPAFSVDKIQMIAISNLGNSLYID